MLSTTTGTALSFSSHSDIRHIFIVRPTCIRRSLKLHNYNITAINNYVITYCSIL